MGNTVCGEEGDEDVIDGAELPVFNENVIKDFAKTSGMTVEQVTLATSTSCYKLFSPE